MIAVINRGKKVETIGDIEAYMVNHARGTVDLYQSPTDKTTVDTFKHKLTLKDSSAAVMVFSEGKVVV